MKQTAVEWLEKQLDILDAYKIKVKTIIKHAKEMEKEQIIDAYRADLFPCSDEDAAQYYNETYGRQTED